MSENSLTTLRCGTGYEMSRLFEQPPHDPGLSVWVCIDCGSLAVHVESSGDIFWYGAQTKSHSTDEPGAPRVSLMGPVFTGPPKTEVHRAGCAYCSARFDCSCDSPGQRHMCPRCDAEAEESKMSGEFPTPDAGQVAQDRAASGPRYPEDLTSAETGAGSTDAF